MFLAVCCVDALAGGGTVDKPTVSSAQCLELAGTRTAERIRTRRLSGEHAEIQDDSPSKYKEGRSFSAVEGCTGWRVGYQWAWHNIYTHDTLAEMCDMRTFCFVFFRRELRSESVISNL